MGSSPVVCLRSLLALVKNGLVDALALVAPWFTSPCAIVVAHEGGVLEGKIYIVGPLSNRLSFWERSF